MSTRLALTSDNASQDAHGNVEIATPNLSQNGHDKARFPAISEEDRASEVSECDLIHVDEHRFDDHRWMQKGYLPRDASSNTSKESPRGTRMSSQIDCAPSRPF